MLPLPTCQQGCKHKYLICHHGLRNYLRMKMVDMTLRLTDLMHNNLNIFYNIFMTVIFTFLSQFRFYGVNLYQEDSKSI